ncbi:MAG: TlpA family protein disulfide reductase [Treponema sp.]|jgi:peroxiredoxin|nr:TlpA family protein disulfide reductase [Treponema sp.]
MKNIFKTIPQSALSAIFSFCAAFLIFLPSQAEAQVSAEAARALRDANIHLEQKTADDFTLPLLGGGNATLSSYRGKVVILNFWATWCPPCRTEMPSMEILYQRFNAQGLEILAVDIGESASSVQQFIRRAGYTFPVILDRNNRVSTVYQVEAIPTTYIIDREGKIIGNVIGSIMWDNPRVIAAIDALLKS